MIGKPACTRCGKSPPYYLRQSYCLPCYRIATDTPDIWDNEPSEEAVEAMVREGMANLPAWWNADSLAMEEREPKSVYVRLAVRVLVSRKKPA